MGLFTKMAELSAVGAVMGTTTSLLSTAAVAVRRKWVPGLAIGGAGGGGGEGGHASRARGAGRGEGGPSGQLKPARPEPCVHVCGEGW